MDLKGPPWSRMCYLHPQKEIYNIILLNPDIWKPINLYLTYEPKMTRELRKDFKLNDEESIQHL